MDNIGKTVKRIKIMLQRRSGKGLWGSRACKNRHRVKKENYIEKLKLVHRGLWDAT